MKKLVILLALMSCFTLLLVACQSNTPDAPNTVHLDSSAFLKSAITIKKGEKVVMANDSSEVHIISNGTWISGSQVPRLEKGAPQINQTINGGDNYSTPPFNTAGTFQLFCTVHPGMNLTVIVK